MLNSNHEIINKIFENKDTQVIQSDVVNLLSQEPTNYNNGGQIFADPKLLQLFEKAEKMASSNQDQFVSIDSLLLACLEVDPQIAKLLKKTGLSINDIKTLISNIRKDNKSDSENSDYNFNAL